jgi:hypothetical protein
MIHKMGHTQWANDVRDGKGKHTWPSGTVYEGQFKEDKRHGKGKMTWGEHNRMPEPKSTISLLAT